MINRLFLESSGVHEIDLLLDSGGKLFPIEIKSGWTINNNFFDGFKYFQPLSGAQPEDGYLAYGGDETQTRSIAHILNWNNLEKIPIR